MLGLDLTEFEGLDELNALTLISELGTPKAITATAHKLARIFYTVMRYGVAYQKRSEEAFTTEHRERQEKNLHRRAKEIQS